MEQNNASSAWQSLHLPEPDSPSKVAEDTLSVRSIPIVDTRIFGRVCAPRELDDVVALCRRANLHPGRSWARDWTWRGQADYRWPLEHGATRRLRRALRTAYWGDVETRVRVYETDVLSEARLAGYGQVGGRALSELELLALLQHNGVATRLLDFTTNLLIGLWFASIDLPDVTGIIVGLSDVRRLSATEVLRADRTPAQLVECTLEPMMFESTPVSGRVTSQQSVFLVGKTQDSVTGSLRLPGPDQVLAFAVLPELKRDVRVWSERLLGYTEKTIFPDVAGFGRHHRAENLLSSVMRRSIDRVLRENEGDTIDTSRPLVRNVMSIKDGLPQANLNGSHDDAPIGHRTNQSISRTDQVVRIVTGDTACLYWCLLNHAAGYPSLGDAGGGRSPDLTMYPDGLLGSLRHRAAFATLSKPQATVVGVAPEDQLVAYQGQSLKRISAAEAKFMERTEQLAVPVPRAQLRELSDDEHATFEDAARARLHWLNGASQVSVAHASEKTRKPAGGKQSKKRTRKTQDDR